MLQKLIIGVGAVTSGTLLIAGVLWYLAYGVDTSPPSESYIPELSHTTTIFWSDEGPVQIHADSQGDFLTALGFVHGTNHSWTILLLRQTALGRLSEWFGRKSFDTDRLVKELRIAADAEAAYQDLKDLEKQHLGSFAAGISTALASRRVRMIPPIVLMEIEPEPWEPWHSLAVERLFAWIAAPVQSLESISASVEAFQRIDQSIRRRLHLFGFENDIGIFSGSGNQSGLGFRYVTGDTGVPIFQPVEFRTANVEKMRALSVPGTLILPAGRNPNFSWVLLMNSDVSISFENFSASELSLAFDRMTDEAGAEELVEIVRVDEKMPIGFEAPDAHRERAVLLDWAGFHVASDTGEWIRLIDGAVPSLSLFRNDGIRVDNGGEMLITGFPSTSRMFGRGTVLVTNSDGGGAIAERLNDLVSGEEHSLDPSSLLRDTYSSAMHPFSDALVSVLEAEFSLNGPESDALSYLRNWDLKFNPESIAASIVDATQLRLSESARDGAAPGVLLDALRSGIADLSMRYGSDMSRWRWETVQGRSVYFPGWVSVQPGDRRTVQQFAREYQPVPIPGRGHPTTLAWGPTRAFAWRMASSAWEGYFSSYPDENFEFERPNVLYGKFLGRFLSENRQTESIRSSAWNEFDERTILHPEK